MHSSNHLLNLAENVLTRHWTVSGVTQLQSGSCASYSTNGTDINGDGSTTNDRPIVVNTSVSPQLVGEDGHFIGGTTGVYYDRAVYNATKTLTPINASAVHFLVPYTPNNALVSQEIGRNSYLEPGTTTNNVSLEKGFDFHERGTLILRAEAQNIGNHDDRFVGETNMSVLNAGSLGFLQSSRNTNDTGDGGSGVRSLVLWAKFEF